MSPGRLLRAPVAVALLGLTAVLVAGASRADTGFDRFLADWRAAVARGDGDAVAARLHGGFLFEGRALDAAGFRRQAWPALFTPALRRCWAVAPVQLERDDRATRSLHCGAYSLHFDAAGGRWALRGFGADAEGG